MLNNGYSLIQETGYNYITKYSDFINYKNTYCTTNSIICLGGGEVGNDNIRVVACAPCSDVIVDTPVNSPVFHGLAYWYLSDTLSVGFAPTSTISQGQADTFDMTGDLRLSWHLSGSDGFRAGSISNPGSTYNKYVFIKETSKKKYLIFFCSLCN